MPDSENIQIKKELIITESEQEKTDFDEDEDEEKSKEDGEGEDESERNDSWMEVKNKRNKRKNRLTTTTNSTNGKQINNNSINSEQLDFKFDSELEYIGGGGGKDVVEKEVDDLDDALCNKLIIVTQTPPQARKSRKMSAKEIDNILKRVEEDLWANKVRNVFFNF